MPNNQTLNKPKKKKSFWAYIKSNLPKIDFTKYDPITGEKIASELPTKSEKHSTSQQLPPAQTLEDRIMRMRKARFEAMADAMKTKKKPVDLWDTAKAATLGTTAGFVASNALNLSRRKMGILSLGLGGLVGAMDIKKQIADYNSQMAAREALLGDKTDREKAYMEYLREKYRY